MDVANNNNNINWELDQVHTDNSFVRIFSR